MGVGMIAIRSRLVHRPESPAPFWYMDKGQSLSRQAKRYVREVCGLTIIFWSKDTIYVLSNSERIMITRWFDTYGTYTRWRNLAKTLQRRNNLDMTFVRNLATRHGFEIHGLYYPPPAIDGITKLKGEYKWQKS